MIKIGFICVHNSCRSQMAEAIAKKYYSDKFYSYSAGTHTKDIINQDAVRVFKIIEGVEMNEEHKPKLISDIPELDIVITMGCNVNCPTLPSKFREDWGLEDPTGKEDSEFEKTIILIKEKMNNLLKRIEEKEIVL